jgi:hypothetical protein
MTLFSSDAITEVHSALSHTVTTPEESQEGTRKIHASETSGYPVKRALRSSLASTALPYFHVTTQDSVRGVVDCPFSFLIHSFFYSKAPG